MLLDESKTLA